jgi:H3 lysine-79-specific histone-lysine N-methyltransferase
MPLLGGKANKFKVDPPKIRIEKVLVERAPPPSKPKPKSRPGPASAGASSARSSPVHRPSPKPSSIRHQSHSPYPSSSDEKRLDRKRKNGVASSARRSPASDHITFDKDSEPEDDGWMNLDTRKKQRRSTSEDNHLDANRKLRNARAFEGRNDNLDFVHAVKVASLEEKCMPVMGAQKEDVAIELQYPSLQPREK